jgi:phage shock protein PspC (stress-responsive transcriptional regulator)
MNTVVVVNLNGLAFQLEEPGYRSLSAYLHAAKQQLKGNPDEPEIMADLEQAIADKCARYLRPHKNVITIEEISAVIEEMGPVQTEPATGGYQPGTTEPQSARSDQQGPAPAPRRLYQIRDGAMFSGVCTGLAAYFNLDVTIVRLVFVVLTLFSAGLWFLVYLTMMLVIPFANTDEEHAAATGTPFNAQELVDRATKHYQQFKNDKEWRRHWRRQRREWRRRWRERADWWGHNVQRHVYQASTPMGYVTQVVTGLMIPVLAIVGVTLFITFLTSLVTLTTTGALFGWTIGGSLPLWAAVVILCVVYGMISSPLHAMRRGIHLIRGGYVQPWHELWDGLFSLAALLIVGWLAYRYVPAVHDLLSDLPEHLELMWRNLRDSIQHAGEAKPVTG